MVIIELRIKNIGENVRIKLIHINGINVSLIILLNILVFEILKLLSNEKA